MQASQQCWASPRSASVVKLNLRFHFYHQIFFKSLFYAYQFNNLIFVKMFIISFIHIWKFGYPIKHFSHLVSEQIYLDISIRILPDILINIYLRADIRCSAGYLPRYQTEYPALDVYPVSCQTARTDIWLIWHPGYPFNWH